jgi:PAS domain S-box-containing protein
MSNSIKEKGFLKRQIILISFAIAFISIIAGYLFYRYEEKSIIENKQQELKAIAELKVYQIEKWMEDKIVNADNMAKNPYSIKEIEDLIEGKGAPNLKEVIISRLKYRKKSFNFEEIYLTTTDGKVVLTTSDKPNQLDTVFLHDIRESLTLKKTKFSDFRFCNTHGKILILLISPNINKNNEVVAFLIFQIDPFNYLYPLIQNWPTNSKTAETFIIEQLGKEVLFLNELRHKKNSALILRISVDNYELPSVKAIKGESGVVEGIDYRGEVVLAYITQIKDTKWFMISKIDKNEVLSELRIRGILIGAIIVLIILFTGSLAASVYNNRQKVILKSLVEMKASGELERKKAEEMIRDSEEKLRIALKATRQGWFEYEITSGKIKISEEYEKILGYEPGELKSDFELFLNNIHPDDIDLLKNVLEECFISGEVRSIEYRRKTKGGKWKWLRTLGKVIEYSKDGKPLKMTGTHTDIDDRKRTEEILKTSEEKFKNLVEKMPDGYYRSTPEGKFLFVNPAFVEMLGYDSSDELLSLSIPDCLYFDEAERNSMENEREEFISDYEVYRLKKKDGSEIWIEDHCRYYKDENEKVIMHEGVCRDITTRKKAEEELRKAKEKAEELSSVKTNFLANMSHELRTPMVGILGFSEVLKNTIQDEEQRNFAEVIYNGGTRLMETLDLILNISAVEMNKVKVYKEPLNIIETVNEVVKSFDVYSEKKNLYLKAESKYKELTINSDKRILTQILNNLINNAIKYTEKGGVIVETGVDKKGDDEFVVIKVIDTGIGIPKDKVELIWEEFRQVSEGLGRTFEGTGLGLSITKKFVEVIGGKIFVEDSEMSRGTTFALMIPLTEKNISRPLKKNEQKSSDEVIIESKFLPEILYVEDDAMSIELVKILLRNICYLDIAKNGADAIELAKKKKYNLILMDINLGRDMSGVEAIEKIRKTDDCEKIPIIAVTALAMKDDKDYFLSKGCDYYISKPFSKKDFLGLIKKVLFPEN